MYVCAGCISAAEFACMYVHIVYRQLSLHVHLCRLHVGGSLCMYVGAGCMSTAVLACTFVQVAYLQLCLHVGLFRLHIGS